jgi:hypothetical protein
MKKYLTLLLLSFVSNIAVAENSINIKILEEKAIEKIRQDFKATSNHQLALIDIDVHKKAQSLSGIFLQFSIADLDSKTKGKFTEHSYDTYWVRFDFQKLEIVEIIESGLETYKLIDDEVLK